MRIQHFTILLNNFFNIVKVLKVNVLQYYKIIFQHSKSLNYCKRFYEVIKKFSTKCFSDKEFHFLQLNKKDFVRDR